MPVKLKLTTTIKKIVSQEGVMIYKRSKKCYAK